LWVSVGSQSESLEFCCHPCKMPIF